jgi:hypothetical protein
MVHSIESGSVIWPARISRTVEPEGRIPEDPGVRMKGAVTRASDLRFYLPSDAKTGALNADTQLCHQPGLCNYALEF